MNFENSFNKHPDLEGKHAILGASDYHWLNYERERLHARMISKYSESIGTMLHELAKDLILRKIKLRKTDHKLVYFHLIRNGIPDYAIDMDRLYPNLMNYVNDAIGFGMEPEVVLKYSDNCFGTADTICSRDHILRIHDLKTGVSPVHIEQLMIYAAIYCLEYKVNPQSFKKIALNLYQGGDIIGDEVAPMYIQDIMDKIIDFDMYINQVKRGGMIYGR